MEITVYSDSKTTCICQHTNNFHFAKIMCLVTFITSKSLLDRCVQADVDVNCDLIGSLRLGTDGNTVFFVVMWHNIYT